MCLLGGVIGTVMYGYKQEHHFHEVKYFNFGVSSLAKIFVQASTVLYIGDTEIHGHYIFCGEANICHLVSILFAFLRFNEPLQFCVNFLLLPIERSMKRHQQFPSVLLASSRNVKHKNEPVRY